ncbi:hypothetical protein SLA2020_156700 [Shorea laevis]
MQKAQPRVPNVQPLPAGYISASVVLILCRLLSELLATPSDLQFVKLDEALSDEDDTDSRVAFFFLYRVRF